MKLKKLMIGIFLGIVCFIGMETVNAASVEDLVNKMQGGVFSNVNYDSSSSKFSLDYNGTNYSFNYNASTLELSGSFVYTDDIVKNDIYYVIQSMTSIWFNLTVPSNITYNYDSDKVIGTIDSAVCNYTSSGVCLNDNGSTMEYKLELSNKLADYVTQGYGNSDNTDDTEGTGTDNPYTGSEDIIIWSILLVIVGGISFVLMKKNGKIARI